MAGTWWNINRKFQKSFWGVTEDVCGGEAGGNGYNKKEEGGLNTRGMLVVTVCRLLTPSRMWLHEEPLALTSPVCLVLPGGALDDRSLKLRREPEQKWPENWGNDPDSERGWKWRDQQEKTLKTSLFETRNARKRLRYGSRSQANCIAGSILQFYLGFFVSGRLCCCTT